MSTVRTNRLSLEFFLLTRGRGVAVGYLKVGYKKLFLLVSSSYHYLIYYRDNTMLVLYDLPWLCYGYIRRHGGATGRPGVCTDMSDNRSDQNSLGIGSSM